MGRRSRVQKARRGQGPRQISGSGAGPDAGTASDEEALSVTHWFEAGQEGEPYAATVRFRGQRIVVNGRPGPQDAFVKDETVEGIVPGCGRVSITTWVHGIHAGEWNVTADLVGRSRLGGARPSFGTMRAPEHTLPRAAWSWTRWALTTGPFGPVTTRWGPLVRLARQPAVVPGSWSALIAIGVAVGVAVQAALLGRASIPVGLGLIVDLGALLSGLLVAKLWFLALRPRGSSRQPVGEGWTVDGLLVAAPVVGAALLVAFGLPIGAFLDASAPGLFFGVAIGRLGCFLTGCCAGRCTRSRWGIWSSDRRVGARRIPTQLLESGAGLAIGLVATLLVFNDIPGLAGAAFVGAVAAYVLARQFLLMLRSEPHNPMRARMTAGVAMVLLLADAIASRVSVS